MRGKGKEWAVGKHCHVCAETDSTEDISDFAEDGYVWCHTCGADTLLVHSGFPFWEPTEQGMSEAKK